MKSLMDRQTKLEERQDQMERDYVSKQVFDVVVPQINKTLDEMRGDIKKLLVLAHNNGKKNTAESN